MDELIVRYLTGETSDLEARALERWRAESSENERAYRELAATWRASERRGGEVRAPAPATRAVLEAAERRRHRRAARTRRARALRSPWLAYGLAAAAVVALVFVGLPDRFGDAAPLLAPVESSASGRDVVTMGLSDGTVVRLAAESRLEFPRRAESREVVLSGRAFFAVAPAETPFVVRTGAVEVVVSGTRFEVATGRDGVRVVVVEGELSVSSEGAPVSVHVGQVAYMGRGEPPRVVGRPDVWSLLEWEGGLLVFQSTPLADVAREVGRHFGVEVDVDEALSDRRITAWFGDEPLEEVVSAICVVAGASCEIVGPTVAIRG